MERSEVFPDGQNKTVQLQKNPYYYNFSRIAAYCHVFCKIFLDVSIAGFII